MPMGNVRCQSCQTICGTPRLPQDVATRFCCEAMGKQLHLEQMNMVPVLSAPLRYTSAAAGNWHTVLLRNDGEAVAFGRRTEGQCNVPALTVAGLVQSKLCNADTKEASVQAGSPSPVRRLGRARRQLQPALKLAARELRYVAVAAGAFHTLLLRSDGVAVSSGSYKSLGLIPKLPAGVKYVDVAANLEHTLLLRNDGHVIACGPDDGSERQQIPLLEVGKKYVAIAAGAHHSVLLRCDGAVVACGHNGDGRCEVPPLPQKAHYTFVAAGLRHTVVWRSDGIALAFGSSSLPAGSQRVQAGPCDIPHEAAAAAQRFPNRNGQIRQQLSRNARICSASTEAAVNLDSKKPKKESPFVLEGGLGLH
ncbi:glo-4 [Symbiodinium pilosum]|uniref:Glo-4 protein n=1 Tax=Symbiodinium pilosum TaxID=2952 RepID=A0A812LHS4_SYMPI|nr:glo-4 [Symbiodinium pilosum]